MKTTKNINRVPTGKPYLRIDAGNEFLYVYGIENKSYIDVDLFEGQKIQHKVKEINYESRRLQ